MQTQSNLLLKAEKDKVEQSMKQLEITQRQLLIAEKTSRDLKKQESDRLREINMLKTRMYTNIAHEFRTPLSVILRFNETSHIPIILLTAKADISSRVEGLKHGANAYLSKPFEKDELLVRIEKLLELPTALQEKYANTEKIGHPRVVSEVLEDQLLAKFNGLIR